MPATPAFHLSRRAVIGSAILAGVGAALANIYPSDISARAFGSSLSSGQQPEILKVTLQINSQPQSLQLEPRVTLRMPYERALACLEGHVQPELVRAVLECLRR